MVGEESSSPREGSYFCVWHQFSDCVHHFPDQLKIQGRGQNWIKLKSFVDIKSLFKKCLRKGDKVFLWVIFFLCGQNVVFESKGTGTQISGKYFALTRFPIQSTLRWNLLTEFIGGLRSPGFMVGLDLKDLFPPKSFYDSMIREASKQHKGVEISLFLLWNITARDIEWKGFLWCGWPGAMTAGGVLKQ